MAVSFPLDVNIVHLSTWWLGEKYDGIRCCWYPKTNIVRFSNQIPIDPPVLTVLPPVIVDGELWFGRGLFSHISLLVNKSRVSWDLLRMTAFDCPMVGLQNKPFEVRYRHLLSQSSTRLLCNKDTKINYLVQQIIDDGGEGAIIRKFGSFYDPGRSQSLLKLKTAAGDREGIVIGISHKGVKLKLPNGITFLVPKEKVEVSNISVGDIVTFSYENNAKRNVPVNPKIFRIRTDLLWKDVVQLFYKEKRHLNESSQPLVKKEGPQSLGYWTIKKMQLFLENFALNRSMDPSVPDTWYRIQEEDLYREKKGRIILKRFGGYSNAIRYLFPDIASSAYALPKFSREYRRGFFERYAMANRLDPLNSSSWYLQPKEKIMSTKNAWQVVFHHGGSLSNALRDLFPEITFDKSRMWEMSWPKKRREFFELYAKQNGFDPLVPAYWYTQSKGKILSTTGVKEILYYYKNNLTKALITLFPDIDFNKRQLAASAFSEISARRKFFETFASDHSFDPLIPENWYRQSRAHIKQTKGARHILFHHRSISRALLDLFPDVAFDKLILWSWSWYLSSNRRRFFEEYAREHSFDPLLPFSWYIQSEDDILAQQEIDKILFYHKNDVSTALLELFPYIGLERQKLWPSKWNKEEERRQFFIDYGKSNEFDPLSPQHWYSHPRDSILQNEEVKQIVKFYDGSIAKALCDLFPDIGLSKAKLLATSSSELPKLRNFFENYSKQHSFDPLNPCNWYKQTKNSILSTRGASQITVTYGTRAQQALLDCFPDIGLNINKLWTSSWLEPLNRRRFFEEYAAKRGFDPLIAKQWYMQSQEDILSTPKASRVLFYHNGSIMKALCDLFPNIGLDKTRKWTSMWHLPKNRRQFFEQYARDNDFDPLAPENWYSHKRHLLSTKGINQVVLHHSSSISKALLNLFPDIGLDKSKLKLVK